MKLKTLLSIIAICSFATLLAQTSANNHRSPYRNMADPNPQAAKTTATNASRCIAIVMTQNDGTLFQPVDSAFYTYSGSRGGNPFGQMKYDNGQSDYCVSSVFSPQTRYSQTFDGQNNVLVHTQQQFDIGSAAFVNAYQSSFTYDAMGNALTQIDQNWVVSSGTWVNSIKYVNTYTSANKLATQTTLVWNGTGWDNYAFYMCIYNSTNNIIADHYSTWNIATSAYNEVNKDTMAYDASNNLIYNINQYYDGTLLLWVNSAKYLYANYLAPGCYQTFINQAWNSGTGTFNNAINDTILYNSFNQPTFVLDRAWRAASGTWVTDSTCAGQHFYYEMFSTGVNEVVNADASLQLFPNPADELINITFNAGSTENTQLSILDMSGRAISVINQKTLKTGANSILYPVNNLAAGVYLVHLVAENRTTTQRFVVTH